MCLLPAIVSDFWRWKPPADSHRSVADSIAVENGQELREDVFGMSKVITLHFEKLIDWLLASGRFNNKSEVFRADLRLLEEHEATAAAANGDERPARLLRCAGRGGPRPNRQAGIAHPPRCLGLDPCAPGPRFGRRREYDILMDPFRQMRYPHSRACSAGFVILGVRPREVLFLLTAHLKT